MDNQTVLQAVRDILGSNRLTADAEAAIALQTFWKDARGNSIPESLVGPIIQKCKQEIANELNDVAVAVAEAIEPSFIDLMPLFPVVAKQYSNWVTYLDGSKAGKVPRVSGTMDFAKSNDPSTWVDYKTACANIQKGLGCKYLGFVTNGAQSGDLTGIDIDGGKTDSGLQPWVLQTLELIAKVAGPTYIEWTPNKGLRAWVRGNFMKHGRRSKYKMAAEPGWNGKAQMVEVFDDGLYFTTTGNRMSNTSEVAVLDHAQTLALLNALEGLSIENPMDAAKKKTTGEFDPAFKNLFDRVGWKPMEDRMNKMIDSRFHDLRLEEGRLVYCPMPSHTPRSVDLVYSRCFGIIPGTDVLHCFGCGWSGDLVKAVRDFDAGDDGGQIVHATMTDAARIICEQNGLNPDEMFPSGELILDIKSDIPQALAPADSPQVQALLIPDDDPTWEFAITREEYEVQMENEFPVLPLKPGYGPTWDDSIMYGIAGDIVRKAATYCEAHPAGMYLDLLVSFGSMVGRDPYFNVSSTHHYANEFMARVGESSKSRKGTGRDVVNEVLRVIDPQWYTACVQSGFGSAEAIINVIRDDSVQSLKKKNNMFEDVRVPGVKDKRLMIREGELASIFQLAGKSESRADIVLRDGWDGLPLHNLVKGKSTNGLSNSNSCQYPHVSISADTTREELLRRMPSGAESNGFGNRFLYCYALRVKKCPNGGPTLNWVEEVQLLHKALQDARDRQYMGMQDSARKLWNRMYMEIEKDMASMHGLAASMTARAAAHVRRLALILCLLDSQDVIETKHLHAAKKIWDYCEDSARYIFGGLTRDQDTILGWLRKTGPVTVPQITQQLFHKHRKADWVRLQVNSLIGAGKVELKGDQVVAKP